MKWILKALGGLLVFGACALAGLRLSRRDMLQAEELAAFRSAFLLLKSEIQYARTPLAEAFSHTAAFNDEQPSVFFYNMAERLQQNDGSSASQVWAESLQALRYSSRLADEDFRRFALLGQTIGCLDGSSQAEGLDAAMHHIDDRIAQLHNHSNSHVRMYRNIGALFGALLAVSLL